MNEERQRKIVYAAEAMRCEKDEKDRADHRFAGWKRRKEERLDSLD